ncbi:hypothetical protein DI09_338p10, partial [Mitosporidium daphniae]
MGAYIDKAVLAAKKLFVVTRHRSYVGLPKDIKDACVVLGLKHTHHSSLLIPSPYVVGNLAKIRNLIRIEYIDKGPFPKETLRFWMNGLGQRAPLGYYIETKG